MGQPLRIITEFRGKELKGSAGEQLRIEASYGLKAGVMIAESSRMRRTVDRLSYAPDRLSTAKAMLAVEQRLVKAFWTIAKQPMPRLSPSEDPASI